MSHKTLIGKKKQQKNNIAPYLGLYYCSVPLRTVSHSDDEFFK